MNYKLLVWNSFGMWAEWVILQKAEKNFKLSFPQFLSMYLSCALGPLVFIVIFLMDVLKDIDDE